MQADGSLTSLSQSTATSTLRGNAARRNLPIAIGFEVVDVGSRTFVIASEAREFMSTAEPGSLPSFQTASVSTWELTANGSLMPRSQDVLTGPSLTTGPASPTSAFPRVTGWRAAGRLEQRPRHQPVPSATTNYR